MAQTALEASLAAIAADRRTPPSVRRLRINMGFNWDPRLRRSQGGLYPWGYGMEIAGRMCFPADAAPVEAPHVFMEYSWIAARPDIGAFRGGWRAHVAATVAHEAAHAIQYWLLQETFPNQRGGFAALDFETSHGPGWQAVYAVMRPPVLHNLANGRRFAIPPPKSSPEYF